MTSKDQRREGLEKTAEYLRSAFPPDCEIETRMEADTGRIRVIRNSEPIHEVWVRRSFLDDHAENPVASLKAWNLVARMRESGSRPVWVGTDRLS
jgi:hypothetical protein